MTGKQRRLGNLIPENTSAVFAPRSSTLNFEMPEMRAQGVVAVKELNTILRSPRYLLYIHLILKPKLPNKCHILAILELLLHGGLPLCQTPQLRACPPRNLHLIRKLLMHGGVLRCNYQLMPPCNPSKRCFLRGPQKICFLPRVILLMGDMLHHLGPLQYCDS